jgi:hypothetical protein
MVQRLEDEGEIKRLQMKCGVKWLAKLDRWRGQQPVPLTRSDAIRRLVARAIDAESSTVKPKKKR